jgi:transposase
MVRIGDPLRKMLMLVDSVLGGLDARLASAYSPRGRPPIPPEFLLRASLIQILCTLSSERQLVEQIGFNLLFGWFVTLGMDGRVWDHSTFSHNRERLFDAGIARAFFERVRALADCMPRRGASRSGQPGRLAGLDERLLGN